jgi:hypothetical protein
MVDLPDLVCAFSLPLGLHERCRSVMKLRHQLLEAEPGSNDKRKVKSLYVLALCVAYLLVGWSKELGPPLAALPWPTQ